MGTLGVDGLGWMIDLSVPCERVTADWMSAFVR